jgi:hypothetical protein
MSPSPNPIPVQNARCPKGHDNPPGRQYCQQCGSRLTTPPPEPRPPEPSQLERLQQSLDSSKSENQQLLQQILALSTEIANLKENLAAQADKPPSSEVASEIHARLNVAETKAANLEPQLARLQQLWKAADEKARALESELLSKLNDSAKGDEKPPSSEVAPEILSRLEVAETKAASLEPQLAQLEQLWKSTDEKAKALASELAVLKLRPAQVVQKSTAALKWLAGALTVVGSIGGFSVDRLMLHPSAKQKPPVAQVSPDLANSQASARNLKSQLDSANDKISQLSAGQTAELAAANKSIADLTIRVNSLTKQAAATDGKFKVAQRSLTAAQIQLSETRQKAADDLAAATQRANAQAASFQTQFRALDNEIMVRDSEISQFRKRVANAQAVPQAHTGSMVWSGTVNGTLRVDVRNGVTKVGSISGRLFPGTPIGISTSDPTHVKLKVLPSKNNGWSEVSFDVSGTGPMRVQINWAGPQ